MEDLLEALLVEAGHVSREQSLGRATRLIQRRLAVHELGHVIGEGALRRTRFGGLVVLDGERIDRFALDERVVLEQAQHVRVCRVEPELVKRIR